MRTLVAKTEFYTIETDVAKNRAYLTFTGFCNKADEISCYLEDVTKAAQQLKTGFTLLTNATEFKTPPAEVAALHEKSQRIWMEKGLSKTAEILSESALTQMTLNRFSKSTGMTKKEFLQRQAAEAWLDSQDG